MQIWELVTSLDKSTAMTDNIFLEEVPLTLHGIAVTNMQWENGKSYVVLVE